MYNVRGFFCEHVLLLLVLIVMAGLFSVRKIYLGNQCMWYDVCADDSAECMNGTCRCMTSYIQIGIHCGMICNVSHSLSCLSTTFKTENISNAITTSLKLYFFFKNRIHSPHALIIIELLMQRGRPFHLRISVYIKYLSIHCLTY